MSNLETVKVNGRRWQVGRDGTLLDRRDTPQDGIRLNRSERTSLQLVRICGRLPLGEIPSSLLEHGYVTDDGRATTVGAVLADVLLADAADC